VFQAHWQYQNVFGADSAWRLMAWTWSSNDQKRLVVVNYSDTQGAGRVILNDATPVNGNDTIPVTDLLSGTCSSFCRSQPLYSPVDMITYILGITYYRSAADLRKNGLYVIVNQWWAQIFSY